MAKNITAQVAGGPRQDVDGCKTVGEIRNKLGLDKSYRATVNGEPEDDTYTLKDYEFVAFAPAVKGGRLAA